jgi:hypothetical protein
VKLSDSVIERVLQDKGYWRRLAAQIIAEAASEKQSSEVDSFTAPAVNLGQILESHSPGSTRVRLSSSTNPGPRRIPQIAEVKTVDPMSGVLLSQKQARRLRRQWDKGRLRAQAEAQKSDMPDELKDHPGVSCDDEHPGQSHSDYMDSEEEEEESTNPLYRQNSARARSISPNRRTRER